MNRIRFVLALASLFALHLDSKGTDALSFPTGPAAWTVTVTVSPNSKTPEKSPNRITSINVVQNREFRHSLITYSNDQSKDFWSIVGTNLFLTQYPNGVVALNPTNKFFFVPFAPSSFDWVQPGLLQEKEPIDYQGAKCFHYKGAMGISPVSGNLGMSAAVDGIPLSVVGEMWVDSKTLLPVAFDDGNILAVFTFQDAPPPSFAPPAKYLDLYKRYKAVNGIPKSS